jgi:predicted lipid-binding transport protein (Tim44 family)
MRCSFVKKHYVRHDKQVTAVVAMAASYWKTPQVTVSIVILAMIAGFLCMRLYSVLGRRAEHGEEPVQTRVEPVAAPAVLPLAEQPAKGSAPQLVQPPMLPVVERGLREIIAADRRFDPLAFVEGARGAYRVILEAFWRGDKEELAQLCDGDVLESFSAAIDARLAAGQTYDNRLVRIEEAALVGASYDAPFASIAVRFISDVAAVTRDADGKVIAGSLTDAVEVRDVWTFRRNLQSTSPDWLLEATDEG